MPDNQDKIILRHRFLIIGCGSIGKRHIKNILQEYPASQICVYDPDQTKLENLPPEVIKILDPSKLWDWAPDIVFICSPSNLHLEQAMEAVRNSCHVFIEKPLSHTWQGVPEFLKLCQNSTKTIQVGANMRYHPGPRLLKTLLDQGVIGRLFLVSTYYGGYLPDWHPSEDYRKSYSASVELGGGIVLDGIHEIDTALWYLGRPKEVKAVVSKTGLLDIETEDVAEITIKGENSSLGHVHLDYLQRPDQRYYSLVGEEGRLDWSIHEQQVRLIKRDGKTEIFPLEHTILEDFNLLYIDQLHDFIGCVEKGTYPLVGPEEGALALMVALTAKDSSFRAIEQYSKERRLCR